MKRLLDIQDLTKTFVTETTFWGQPKSYLDAVNKVSFELRELEHLGIVGESGSGKTTLARVLMRLMLASDGKVTWCPQNTELNEVEQSQWAQHIQMVFQDPFSSLDPRFTILQTLQESLLRFKLSKQEVYQRCAQVLEEVGLQEEMLMRLPHEFSGGERQRIAIARALLFEPKVIILDEAVSALDVLVQRQILELLDNVAQKFGITYIFISHNIRVVKRLCQRVAVMCRGKFVEMGSTDLVLANPQHLYTQELLEAALYFKVPDLPIDFSLGEQWHQVENDHWVLQD